jgi:hypothetical protein
MVVRTRSSVVVRAMRATPGVASEVEIPEAGIVIHTGGRQVARVSLTNAAGWNEHVIRLPAEAVAEGETALELRGRYAAFHYWFYQ